MEQLLEKVKTYDFGQSRLPLTELSDRIRAAYGKPAELKDIEKGLCAVLDADATYAGKQYICRELSIIGTAQSVPTLSEKLTDEKLSDMARYALERIPGQEVDSALLVALGKVSGKAKVGIINSLGERRCLKAVSVLSKLVGDSDKIIAEAAISALGKIGGDEAAGVLAKAKGTVSKSLKIVILDAYLKCADRYVTEGKKTEALPIYKELYKQEYPQLIRTAAMRGMVSAGQEK
jgi:HEAT repeat protein